MRTFDYAFLKRELFPLDLVNLLMDLTGQRTLTELRIEEYARVFMNLESNAKRRSIVHSSAMEGISVSSERIEAIVTYHNAPASHNELEIFGYRNAQHDILFGYDELEVRNEDILHLHQRMMCRAGYKQGGQFKTDDSVFPTVDCDAGWHAHFRPVSAGDTYQVMEQLCNAYRSAREDAQIPPLLLIPCVAADFLYILPFQEGNGRMSRLLSMLMLYKSGWDVGKYVSFDEKLHSHQAEFCEALRLSSRGWTEGRNTYIPFITFFLGILQLCYKELDSCLSGRERSGLTKTARIEATMLRSQAPISTKEICEILPDVGRSTVESVLSAMLDSGSIRKTGFGRATRYVRT